MKIPCLLITTPRTLTDISWAGTLCSKPSLFRNFAGHNAGRGTKINIKVLPSF